MPDIGPLAPGAQVIVVPYPDVPSDLVSRLNAVIASLNRTSTHLSNSSERLQSVMHQSNSAVQQVVSISHGKTTNALARTWSLTSKDGEQPQIGLSSAAGHLNSVSSAISEALPAVSSGMSTIAMLQSNSGRVPASQAGAVQAEITRLTNALNNIGLALDGAAKLLGTLNNGWPTACATGFIPGSSSYPTFAPDSFDPAIQDGKANMVGEPGAGGQIATFNLKDGTEVSITQSGLNHSFKHAAEWFGRAVTGADEATWQDLIAQAIKSKLIFNWSASGRPTIAVLARLPFNNQLQYFAVQFDRNTGQLVTAFRPNPDQLGAMLRAAGVGK